MKHKIVIFRIAHVDAMSEPMPANKVQNFIESIEKIGADIVDIIDTGRHYETRIDDNTYACMSAYTYTEDDIIIIDDDDDDDWGEDIIVKEDED